MTPAVTPAPWRACFPDVLVAAAAVALARWLLPPQSTHELTGTVWPPFLLVIPGVFALSVFAARLVDQRDALVRPVLAGGLLTLVLALLLAGTVADTDVLRAVSCCACWLAALLALAWRSGLVWRNAIHAARQGMLVAPRHHLPVHVILRRQRTLLMLLVARDLTLKYRGSTLGMLWSLANPLVMTVTYGLVFTYVYPSRIEGFVYVLLLGILAWSFFAVTARMATSAIVDSGSLVKNVYFPRLVLPTATVLFNLSQYVVALVVLVPILSVATGHLPSLLFLLVPVPLALLVMFTWGLSLILAATTARLRDVQHLLDVALQVLFWATPVVYTLDIFPPGPWATLALFSPLAPFITALRSLAFAAEWPSAPVVTLMVLYAGCTVAIGLGVFVRLEEQFAESL
jgi:lipopolysaccharide transport system permease protein